MIHHIFNYMILDGRAPLFYPVEMARRKDHQEHIRSLQQSGTSYHVTLPIRMIRALGWQERQKLIVKRVRGGLLLLDWRRRGR